MPFFVTPFVIYVIGVFVAYLADRHPGRRTGARFVEIALLWNLVFFGAWGLFGVFSHLGPYSGQIAEGIGYAPSMFQWEVGFGDLVISVLGILAYWWRDRWLTAAVVAVAIAYWGDAIGHVMSYYSDGNTAPDNVWAIPSDILQPLIAVILLVLYRRGLGRLPEVPKHGVVGVEGVTSRSG
jgi:hypothetical protein